MAQDLISTYRFSVKIPDVDTIGYFSRCYGLELSFELYEYREGGNNDYVHHLPGGLRYPNLVLTRGLTNEQALLKWFWATHTRRSARRSGDARRRQRRRATGRSTTPSRSGGRDRRSRATGRRSPTETLEIAHSGLKMA